MTLPKILQRKNEVASNKTVKDRNAVTPETPKKDDIKLQTLSPEKNMKS